MLVALETQTCWCLHDKNVDSIESTQQKTSVQYCVMFMGKVNADQTHLQMVQFGTIHQHGTSNRELVFRNLMFSFHGKTIYTQQSFSTRTLLMLEQDLDIVESNRIIYSPFLLQLLSRHPA